MDNTRRDLQAVHVWCIYCFLIFHLLIYLSSNCTTFRSTSNLTIHPVRYGFAPVQYKAGQYKPTFSGLGSQSKETSKSFPLNPIQKGTSLSTIHQREPRYNCLDGEGARLCLSSGSSTCDSRIPTTPDREVNRIPSRRTFSWSTRLRFHA